MSKKLRHHHESCKYYIRAEERGNIACKHNNNDFNVQALSAAQHHLAAVATERSVYNKALEDSKQWVRESFQDASGHFCPPPLFCNLRRQHDNCLHLSFDFAQSVAYPSNPLQPGPLYFLSERKVYLFRICNEAIPRQLMRQSIMEKVNKGEPTHSKSIN